MGFPDAMVRTYLTIALPLLLNGVNSLGGQHHQQAPLGEIDEDPPGVPQAQFDAFRSGEGCPDYRHYSAYPQYVYHLHQTLIPSVPCFITNYVAEWIFASQLTVNNSFPRSDGPMALPFQRPAPICRTFKSDSVEKVIRDMTARMKEKDLARLFENAFPNTLDTTVRWHVDEKTAKAKKKKKQQKGHGQEQHQHWEGRAQSFIVTGDIDAEWLRDSTGQLAAYQAFAAHDEKLHDLILGAIHTQTEFVLVSPYCNAFQPPPPSRLAASANGQDDRVHPTYEPSVVFECKWELDSLANFLALANRFHNATGSTAYLTPRWYAALDTVLKVLERQSDPTFDPGSGRFDRNEYRFQRSTDVGTETLALAGTGNPLNAGTGLVRSAFRPSDDATILGFFIPANAMMAVELMRTAEVLSTVGGKRETELAAQVRGRGERLARAVWEHGVVTHRHFGRVFAAEVDGYGSAIVMDDANVPSLLSLPVLGFVDRQDETYRNTRKMVLSKEGNPYFLQGRVFRGIGGPHVGLQNTWPMSLLIQAQTSDDDEEIMEAIHLVRNASLLGLIHESVHVDYLTEYTRSWFAWANSIFAQTILDLARRKPHLLFGEGAEPYVVE
ncbi:MAG: hypothetical protein M1816_001393 [Peltula sp. TS41687]|nr:MAG: hypothetical protein M1816_001393 [Peltula sp. TS41687]